MRWVAVLAVSLAVPGCGNGDGGGTGRVPGPATADLDLGRRVYQANCAACHGASGQGGIGPQLGDGAVVEQYPDPLAHRSVVVEGRGGMPAWGSQLTEEEIDAVVAYEREGL